MYHCHALVSYTDRHVLNGTTPSGNSSDVSADEPSNHLLFDSVSLVYSVVKGLSVQIQVSPQDTITHFSYSIQPSEVKCLTSSLLIDASSSLGVDSAICMKDNRPVLEHRGVVTQGCPRVSVADLSYSVFANETTAGVRLEGTDNTMVMNKHLSAILDTVQGYVQLNMPISMLADEQRVEGALRRFLQ